jgi:hypothetical protein
MSVLHNFPYLSLQLDEIFGERCTSVRSNNNKDEEGSFNNGRIPMALKRKKHEAGGGRLTCFSRTQVYEKEGTIAQIYYLKRAGILNVAGYKLKFY